MSSPTVLMTIEFPLEDHDRRAVRDASGGAEFRRIVCNTQEELDALDGANVHALMTESVPQNLKTFRDLKLVQLVSAGTDHLPPSHPVWASGIPVATATGIHSVPMAQYTTGMLLSMVHHFRELDEFPRTRRWPTGKEMMQGTVVRGWTAGIIGYGSIGRECARQLSQLGLRIVAMKRDPTKREERGFEGWPGTGDPDGKLPERWFAPEQIKEMLPLCDVLVVTAPRNPQTLGLVRAAELALMKPSARIIIISRGGIIDEHDLAAALRTKRLAGAAVDCFMPEPPPADHPLFGLPNCLMTPHMSGVYDEYLPVLMRLLCENLRRTAKGQKPLNYVTKKPV